VDLFLRLFVLSRLGLAGCEVRRRALVVMIALWRWGMTVLMALVVVVVRAGSGATESAALGGDN
jgi:hypothetical protein